MYICLTSPEFNIPFIEQSPQHPGIPGSSRAGSTVDESSFNMSQHNSRVGLEDIPVDNAVSETSSNLFTGLPASKDSSNTNGNKGNKGTSMSSIPRLAHALSYGSLPLAAKRASSFDFENDQSPPRTVSQADTVQSTVPSTASHALSSVLHLVDSRRPSYASMATRSSQGSHTYDDPNLDSTSGSPLPYNQLPQSLDPSELSLITNFGAALSSDSQPYNPSKVTYPTKVRRLSLIRMLSMYTSNKEQVFDANSMYNEQMNSRALEQFTDMGSSGPNSRSVSVASTSSDTKILQPTTPKKGKRSFLGKLIARRDSHADLKSRKWSQPQNPQLESSHLFTKASRRSGTDTSITTPKVLSSSTFPSGDIWHKSSVSSSTKERGRLLEAPSIFGNPRHRSRSAGSSKAVPDPSQPLEPFPKELAAETERYKKFSLDTDLEHMNGIVKPRPLSLTTTAGVRASRRSSFGKLEQGLTGPQSRQGSGSSFKQGWIPPESWDVETTVQEPVPAWGAGFDPNSGIKKPTNHFFRVFREDGTFGTLNCPLDISVSELIQLLGRKFFLNNVNGYQLSVRTGKLVRIMKPYEKPLIFQKMLLEFMGYTEKDRLGDVGREDLSYLCRFEFSKSAIRTFTRQEEALMTRDFDHVNLKCMNLQTIPIVFYHHANQIESLDVSENPSISIPLDFIQACTRLTEIKYVNNCSRQFPVNLTRAVNLTHLDLSNNLLVDIDDVDFSCFPNLKVLDMQGNRLNSLPDGIAQLKSLTVLNLSSNNITELNPNLCTITSLKELDLSFNRITALPKTIGELKKLEKLLITNNYLTKTLPATFKDLIALTELDVRYNSLQNIDILSQLPNLEILYCSKNSVNNCEKSFLKLKLFYFDRNPVTKFSFEEFHSNLTILNLSKAKLTNLTEQFIECILNVESLVLDKNHLTTLPLNIGSLKRLVSLSIVANELASLPPGIGNLKSLQALNLHSNNLKSLPEEIWNLSSLAILNVSSNLLESFPKPNFHVSSISSDSSYKMTAIQPESIDSNYEIRSLNDRRPSAYSITSYALSPKDLPSRRGSIFPLASSTPGINTHKDSISSSPMGRQSLAQSLLVLIIADNSLNDDCFEEISLLSELQVLNISYNLLMDIPCGALGRLTRLRDLYLSGNTLSSLPADDFENIQALRTFYVNANKLHSLPAEMGKISHLQVLDVGSNNLRYNVNNWPYDWNWNWNLELKYLNFSGNRRLEIKNVCNQGSQAARGDIHRNLSDFTVLSDLRILGLMDVTLTTPSVPDQTENCRVRTYGSEVLWMRYGMADSLGDHNNLSMMDMVIERFRGNEKEAVIGLFDGRNENMDGGNKVSKLIQETFGNIFTDEIRKMRESDTMSDALRRAFLYTNKEIGNTTMLPREEIPHTFIAHRSSTAASLNVHDRMTGSCATIVYINETKMYVANVGDTMAVLAKGDGQYQVATKKHDPTTQEELARIRGGAGVVSSTGKLDNVLDVSRAIGFYNLIPHIHAAPSISEYDLTDADDFLILASKQLWEYVSFEVAVDLARTEIDDPMLAAQKLRDFAMAYGCNDKIMVIVITVGGFRKKPKYKAGVRGGINTLGAIPGVEEELFPALLKKRRDRSLLPEDSTLARLGEEVEPPVGEVAMVFTDIKNSTLLWETYPVAMRSAIKTHNSIMRRHIRIMGGYEVKTEGDAFIVSFPTPTSALLWCFSVQTQLLVADWPAEIVESEQGYPILDENGEILFRGLSVRMGINWGSPVFETDVITKRMDYFGPMVNRTARISAVADGGQITLSTDFLAEIKRLIECHAKYAKGESSLAEAYGDEAMGISVDRDIKVLLNLGYVVRELGELKLKGLENPEFISVIYPNSLKGRIPYHQKDREEQVQQQQQVTQAHVKQQKERNKSVSLQVGQQARRIGDLTVDHLTQLRWISNRLEKICSQMNMGMSGTIPHVKEFNRKTSQTISTLIPNTDYDYVLFFEHLVTRIENALTTLYVRTMIGTILNEGNPYVADLSAMLVALSDLSGKLKTGEVTAEIYE